MKITECKTGIQKEAEITVIRSNEMKRLSKSKFYFDWVNVDQSAKIYVLTESGLRDILGAIAILKYPDEFRYEIKLLAVSRENVGKEKIYDGIAGCLLAYACKECLRENGVLACVSLVPKTKLKSHYINKYGMEDAGWQIYLSGLSLLKLTNTYYL